MSETVIKVENLGKKFRINSHRAGDLRNAFGNFLTSVNPFSKNNPKRLAKNIEGEFWALKDINFEIKKGEAVGIIGRNGAGKSTLLKILSRITKPTEGRLTIDGKVSSLLEVGTGFHMELTGRENIFLNGTILGMKRREIKAKFDEIVSFSGVEKFIDTPVKHFSSGMLVRLAFSVAAHLDPEILIVDEVLAVGDAEFQKKCLGKMEDVTGQGRTVLFVSHNMGAVRNLCMHGILLENGNIKMISSISDVISKYLSFGISSGNFVKDKIDNKTIWLREAELSLFENISTTELKIEVTILSAIDKKLSIDFRFSDLTLNQIAFTSLGAFNENEKIKVTPGPNKFFITIDISLLAVGTYSLSIDLTDPDISYYDRNDHCLQFEIVGLIPSSDYRKLRYDWNYGAIQLKSYLNN